MPGFENFLASLGLGQPAPPPVDPLQALMARQPITDPMAPQPNFMQQAGVTPDVPQPVQPPQAPPQPDTLRQPRERRSVLDTIGRISDVLAKVGGAEAQYQPTMDAREDRSIALGDHARTVDLDAIRKTLLQQQVGAGESAVQTQEQAVLGRAVRGLQAIKAGGGDVARAWPILAKQAGIPDDKAAALGQIFQSDPEALPGFASMLGQQQEFGLQPFYAKDPATGKLQAFQLGKDGTVQPINLGGSEPIDPVKFVDLGGTQAGVGTRSGNVTRILPKTEAPGKGADRASRERIAGAGNASRERIAAMPARGKATTAATDTSTMAAAAQGNLDELKTIYGDLKKLGASVSPSQGTGANILARAKTSGAGQFIGGTLGTEAQTKLDRVASIRPGLMQSLAKATGMTGKQLDSNADVKLFMQTVTDPSKSYEANMAAIAGLERFLKENTKKAAPAAPARAPAPRKGGPTVSNW
jgi:hypothetical protein